jgi:hypothetical protein
MSLAAGTIVSVTAVGLGLLRILMWVDMICTYGGTLIEQWSCWFRDQTALMHFLRFILEFSSMALAQGVSIARLLLSHGSRVPSVIVVWLLKWACLKFWRTLSPLLVMHHLNHMTVDQFVSLPFVKHSFMSYLGSCLLQWKPRFQRNSEKVSL